MLNKNSMKRNFSKNKKKNSIRCVEKLEVVYENDSIPKHGLKSKKNKINQVWVRKDLLQVLEKLDEVNLNSLSSLAKLSKGIANNSVIRNNVVKSVKTH